jgi:hypothetical protein
VFHHAAGVSLFAESGCAAAPAQSVVNSSPLVNNDRDFARAPGSASPSQSTPRRPRAATPQRSRRLRRARSPILPRLLRSLLSLGRSTLGVARSLPALVGVLLPAGFPVAIKSQSLPALSARASSPAPYLISASRWLPEVRLRPRPQRSRLEGGCQAVLSLGFCDSFALPFRTSCWAKSPA